MGLSDLERALKSIPIEERKELFREILSEKHSPWNDELLKEYLIKNAGYGMSKHQLYDLVKDLPVNHQNAVKIYCEIFYLDAIEDYLMENEGEMFPVRFLVEELGIHPSFKMSISSFLSTYAEKKSNNIVKIKVGGKGYFYKYSKKCTEIVSSTFENRKRICFIRDCKKCQMNNY